MCSAASPECFTLVLAVRIGESIFNFLSGSFCGFQCGLADEVSIYCIAAGESCLLKC